MCGGSVPSSILAGRQPADEVVAGSSLAARFNVCVVDVDVEVGGAAAPAPSVGGELRSGELLLPAFSAWSPTALGGETRPFCGRGGAVVSKIGSDYWDGGEDGEREKEKLG